MKKIVIISFMLIMAISTITTAKTLEIVDMADRKITVPHDPSKIICIGPGALRLIVYLNAQDKLAGVEDMEKLNPGGRPYWLANPQLANLPRIGPGGPASINKKPDLEAIVSAHPNIIFITQADAALANEVQQQLGIPLVVLSYGAFATFDEKIYDSIRLAGKILNRDSRAEAVIQFIESARKELQEKTKGIPDNEKPTVFVGGIGFRGAYGIESTEKNYIPLKWANAKNIAENLPASEATHVFIDKEKLLALNPDIIFIDGGGMELVRQDMLKKPQYYNALNAFQNKQVYSLLPFNFYTTNIETALADAYVIARIVDPKTFADLDIEKKTDEIYTFMVGKPVYADMKKRYGKIGQLFEMKGK
ncbi:MAG: iron ABC transporter substrate-binding protein [Desulfobacterales bacterium]|nr:iron ABC transporter substrate-binding protein [Desulfobacterales bacterium]